MPEPQIEPFSVPEIVFDGISDIKIIEGLVRIALFSKRNGHNELIGRLAIPLSELPDVTQSLAIALADAVRKVVRPALSS